MGFRSSHHDNSRAPGRNEPIKFPSLPHHDREEVANNPSHSTEIEAKFYIPADVAKKVIKGLPFTMIEQHYFPREAVEELLRDFQVAEQVPDVGDFSSARIRRARAPSGEVSYAIEFKGKKATFEGSRIVRREFGISIPRGVYSRLLSSATAGTLRKRRHDIDGEIHHSGTKYRTTAQIDLVLAAGKNLKDVKVHFSTVDIELPRVEFVTSLRAGKHSWQFLHKCLDITFGESDAARELSTRRIAKYGFDAARLKALKTLQEEARQTRGK
jgi:hypothetical protein